MTRVRQCIGRGIGKTSGVRARLGGSDIVGRVVGVFPHIGARDVRRDDVARSVSTHRKVHQVVPGAARKDAGHTESDKCSKEGAGLSHMAIHLVAGRGDGAAPASVLG